MASWFPQLFDSDQFKVFGSIKPPVDNQYFQATGGQGLFLFLTKIFKFLGVLAGIYMAFQIVSAGYMYLSANGDSKLTAIAWTKIWQSILGLVIVASAFVIVALVERFTGLQIRNFQICGPNGCV